MPAKRLEASVRQEPGGAVLDLRGEINSFAQEALDAAYAEAEAKDPEAILLKFDGVDYINSTGTALIVGMLARARLQAPPPGLRPLRPLRRDLRDHPTLRLFERLPGRRERPERGVGVLMSAQKETKRTCLARCSPYMVSTRRYKGYTGKGGSTCPRHR